jgi:catechol 2,3-dioxygenase-like lactoylglutathione lyase family enzyme
LESFILTIITLGVADLPRAIRFYRDGLGFPTDAKDDATIAIFMTQGRCSQLEALWPAAAKFRRTPSPDR